MSDETNETQSTDSGAENGGEAVAEYGASNLTKYILLGVIVVLAFALSYGIAQASSRQDSQVVAESGTVALATTAGGAQSAGGG